MGTAYYVAPEQIMSSHAVDTRADLYALTAVLFEMLTEHPPYTGGSALDIILMHTQAEIPSLCRLCSELPPQMDVFLRKALAKAPDERFQSPAEYIAAIEQLQQLVRGEAVTPQQQARLILLDSGQVFPLQGAKLLIGREDPRREIHPDILINDVSKTVGRIHACLSCQQGQWCIEDRNARNKTRLNGDVLIPYEPKPLKDGDRLRFGRVEARFELQ
jgi:serine/threonine-protein kinase